MSAHKYTNLFSLDFHAKQLSIKHNGNTYVLDAPGDYVFNVDSASSYYVIRHKVQYTYKDAVYTVNGMKYTVVTQWVDYPADFTLIDSIMDTIRNRQFFRVSRFAFDYWFKFPKSISFIERTDKKTGITRLEKPKILHSIQRTAEYESESKQ